MMGYFRLPKTKPVYLRLWQVEHGDAEPASLFIVMSELTYVVSKLGLEGDVKCCTIASHLIGILSSAKVTQHTVN